MLERWRINFSRTKTDLPVGFFLNKLKIGLRGKSSTLSTLRLIGSGKKYGCGAVEAHG